MTGEVFWTKVANAARLAEEILTELQTGRSVILTCNSQIPWRDDLAILLRDQLELYADARTPDILSAASVTNAGEYLLRRYFSERERVHFYPTGTRTAADFMANNPNSPLHRRYLLIPDIPADPAGTRSWLTTVEEYERKTAGKDHALFFLILSDSSAVSSDTAATFSFEDYIGDFDCFLLCLNLLAGEKCSIIEKQYTAELAVRLSENRIEHASALTVFHHDLISETAACMKSVYPELDEDDLERRVQDALWETQIRVIYAELEHFRRRFIKKYGSRLTPYLPVKDEAKEEIHDPEGLELGHLRYLCAQNRLAERNDYDRLCLMHDARNLLAHGNTIPYNKLLTLRVL